MSHSSGTGNGCLRGGGLVYSRWSGAVRRALRQSIDLLSEE